MRHARLTEDTESSKRTEVLSLGIVLAIGDAFRVTFEGTLHFSGLPVPHLHRAVVAR